MDIQETVAAIAKKKISSFDLTKVYLDQIEKVDPKINAFLLKRDEEALTEAKTSDTSTTSLPLTGIPCALKDNYSVKGVKMTAGSKVLDTYISPYNATVVDRLKGSILLGKTNLDAFAFGASTENSGYFLTKNPWDITRVAGGSSGGSAAAVAAGMAMFAMGTDTGGSIRQPAGFCGVVGLKPTYGRSSRYGLAAMGSSLDCPGPITQTVTDAAYILSLISGYDAHDATSSREIVPDFTTFNNVKGKRVGIPKEFFDSKDGKGLDPLVHAKVLETIEIMKKLGMEMVEVTIPHFSYALPVYYIITPSEISANMTRYDGIRYGHTKDSLENISLQELYEYSRSVFEEEVKRRIYIGTYALSSGYYDAYYRKAMQVRKLISMEIEEVLTEVDVIVGPTSPTTAFKIGENTDDPIAMYLADMYTVTANIAGIPSISIPCGLANGLPVGFQIMGRQFGESDVLDTAYALEQELQFRAVNEKILQNILA